MRNLLSLLIIAACFLYAQHSDAACPPGYDCEAMERIAKDAQDHTAATVPVLGGVAQLFDEPCGSIPGTFQFIVRNPNTRFAMPIASGCWKFSTVMPGYIEYSGQDGGDVWPLCATTFYGRYKDLNGKIAKICKGKK